MSSIWGAVISSGAAIGAGALAANATTNAANAAGKISQQSSAAQLRFLGQQNGIARADRAPYVAGGAGAFSEFLKQLGVSPAPSTGANVGVGQGSYGSRLIPLPGISTTSVHSKQSRGGGLELTAFTPEVRPGGADGQQLFYDPGNHVIVDGGGQTVASVPQSGRIAGLINGYNNPVEVRDGALYGIGKQGANPLNLNLTPLTQEQKDAYGKPTTGMSDPSSRYGAFFESPGYKFLYDESMRAARASGAAKGSLYSGSMLKELQNRAQGLASQEYGGYIGRLADASRIGQAAASDQAASASNLGTTGAQVLSNSASDRANAQLIAGASSASAISGVGTTLGSIFDTYYKNRVPATPTSRVPATQPGKGP